jgi:SAM-dependent methyltransferase
MKWRAKALAFKLLSALPGGGAFYDYAREHITQSLVPNKGRVSQKLDVGLMYFNWLTKHGMASRLTEGVHLDFGTGWHPTIPLLYYALGVNRQHLFDVAPHLSGPRLAQTINTFLAVVSDSQWPHRGRLRRLPAPLKQTEWRRYLEELGITYHAPYGDAFASLTDSMDVVTSTEVLLHIPRSVMPGCLREIHTSLKPGGVFLAPVHLRDILVGNLYTSADKYNQLRYSPEKWERWFHSSIMYYNRLKAPDYRELLEKAGFEVVHFEVEPATAEDYKELDRIKVAACFQRFSREELAARHLFFVARKP